MQDNVAAAEVSVTRRLPRGGRLICILGIDGSGKSTQAAALAESLQEQDVDAVHAWARWKPILMLPARLLGRGIIRGKGVSPDDYRDFTDSKRAVLRGRLQASLWKNFALLEHSCQAFIKVRVPMLMGKTVVADRYVFDTLIDLAVNLGVPPDDLLNEPLLRLFPRPNLSILLDLSPKVGADRKGDGTPEEYLAERRDLYLQLSSALGMEQIDADRSPAEIHAEIRKRVWKKLGF
jgi:thymidylate kinase